MAEDKKKYKSREEREQNSNGIFDRFNGDSSNLPLVVGNKYVYKNKAGNYTTGIYQGQKDGKLSFSNGIENPYDGSSYVEPLNEDDEEEQFKKYNNGYEGEQIDLNDFFDTKEKVPGNYQIYDYDPDIDEDVHVPSNETKTEGNAPKKEATTQAVKMEKPIGGVSVQQPLKVEQPSNTINMPKVEETPKAETQKQATKAPTQPKGSIIERIMAANPTVTNNISQQATKIFDKPADVHTVTESQLEEQDDKQSTGTSIKPVAIAPTSARQATASQPSTAATTTTAPVVTAPKTGMPEVPSYYKEDGKTFKSGDEYANEVNNAIAAYQPTMPAYKEPTYEDRALKAYEALYNAAEQNKKDDETERKRANQRAYWAALGDGLNAIFNLVGTYNGKKNYISDDPSKTLSAANLARYEKYVKDTKDARDAAQKLAYQNLTAEQLENRRRKQDAQTENQNALKDYNARSTANNNWANNAIKGRNTAETNAMKADAQAEKVRANKAKESTNNANSATQRMNATTRAAAEARKQAGDTTVVDDGTTKKTTTRIPNNAKKQSGNKVIRRKGATTSTHTKYTSK